MLYGFIKPSVSRVLVALLFAGSLAGSLFAQGNNFGLNSLRGSYALQESGSVGGNPVLSAGVISFTGSGTVSGTATGRWNGTDFVSATFTGFTTINPDGTGTMELVFSYPQSSYDPATDSTVSRTVVVAANYALVVVNGNQVLGIRTTGGQSVTLRLERQIAPAP